MAGLLQAAGIPPDRIRPEPTARNTFGSVVACIRLLRGIGHAGPVVVATHRYHLPRALALFRAAGMSARAVPPPASPSIARQPRHWYGRLREVPGLPADVALMLYARLRRRI